MNRIRKHLLIYTLVAFGSVECQTSREPATLAENLRRAAYRGNLERMRQIFEQSPSVLESRSDPNRVFHFPKRTATTPPPFEELEPHRFTALHYAVFMFRTNAVVWLLAKGAEVNAGDRDGVTPLHWAAVGGDLNTVKILLERGADPSARDIAGQTPAMDATRNEHWEIAAYLEKSVAETTRH